MVKTGNIKIRDDVYYIVIFTDSVNERVDIFKTPEDYTRYNTEDCVMSYISGNPAKIYGTKSIYMSYLSIKNTVASMHVEEKRETVIKDGRFILNITKTSLDESLSYKLSMVNGRIETEEYYYDNDYLIINDIKNEMYNPTDKPINIGDYLDMNTLYKTTTTSTTSYYSYDELLQMYPEVKHVLDNDYVVVNSYEEAEERLKFWIDSKEQLKSFDIESTGTDWGPTSQCRITGVFLGLDESWSTYFPFRQDNFEYNLPIEFLRRIFDAINNQPPAPEVILLAHNVLFEIQGFYQEFTDYVRCDVDTYLLSILVNPVQSKGTHTLKALTSKADGKFYLSLEHIFKGKVQFNVLPPEIVKLYGCPDATSPAKVYKYLMKKIPKDEYFMITLENTLPVIKAMNTFYGMRLNQDRLSELLEIAENDAEKLKMIFMKHLKITGNINSPEVMRDVLYNKLRCPVEMRSDSGLPSVNKAAIAQIIKSGYRDPGDAIPKDIISADGKTVLVKGIDLASNKYAVLLVYQQYKLLLKEVGALRRLKTKSVAEFFKFYINQSGAGSNRQTSDAQQFDDLMKSCAVADSKYHGLVSCDWKQVELRVLAGLAGQQDLIELEKNPDVDIHRAILSIITGKPMYMISEEERKKGKSVNFGVVYMMSEYGLAQREYGTRYTKEQLNEKKKAIADFFNGLPYIKTFLKNNELFLKEHGYIKTAFNYYRYFPQLLDDTVSDKDKKKLIRAGNNTPVQGTAAQMLKIVEGKVWDYIRDHGWDKVKDYDGIKLPMVRMILPIHDEILLSYDKSIPKEEIIKMFKECMELDFDKMPPFFAAPAFIDSWYDGKDSAYEVDIRVRDKIVEDYKNGMLTFSEDNYLDFLNGCRDREISEYMNNLIDTYKTVDEVAKHVTDDNLTHVLIETKLSKSDRKKLTHQERIVEATRRYMEGYTPKEEPKTGEDYTVMIDTETWFEESQEVDQFGDLVETNVEETDEYYEEIPDVEQDEVKDNTKVLYGLNEVIIDMSTATDEQLQEILKLCDDKDFYTVIIMKGERIVKTEYKVGWIPEQIQSILEGSVNG